MGNFKHWLEEPEPDLPRIDDPRVVNIWEEPEDECDDNPLPRYARVRVEFKPWEDDDYTEVLSYYEYLEFLKTPAEIKKREYTCPEIEAMGKSAEALFSLCGEFVKKV